MTFDYIVSDYITGKPVRNIGSEVSRQIFEKFLVDEKGYAKKDDTLISFMNRFYKETSVPLDFVYTGKLMMAVSSLFDEKILNSEAKLLVFHTGGLQGNQSLPNGTLHY